MPQVTNSPEEMLPEFVYMSIYSKLNNPGSLDKKNINLHRCYNPISKRMQITAYANASKFDGAIVIFEDFDDQFQEVFSLKTKYISSVQFKYPTII